jgi:tetratricopeptide (TPR) repeat protein
MKKTFFILISSFSFTIYAQEVKELKFDNKQFLKEISDNACKCVDSISTYNKSVDSVSANINSCIEKQVGAYQLGIKIGSIKDLEDKAEEVNGKKNIKINIDLNKNSKEHKKYYYEIERYLVDNCPAIKKKIAANDKHNENSVSNNKESIKFYDLGIDESTNEKYEKAIEYFKKALIFDPKFAFAYDNMGVCYRKLNEFDKAIDAYEKSLEIDPNGLMPLQNIAIVYQYKKEYKKSVKAYEKLAKIDPKNPEVFYGIGQIYTQFLFDYEKALDNLCQAYNIYVEQKSPYRTDAEKLIQQVYNELKKQGKESIFMDTLKKYHISQN